MTICDVCHSSIPDDARFCPACGNEVISADSPTVDRGAAPPSRRPASDSRPTSSSSSGSFSHGRFLPGQMLGSRYRIVAMLGRGGMGEVYRADDLTLGQEVALKFLPPEIGSDANRLDRFRQEVRIARQVSHPNVCRVYDIGEFEGEHFLSMEYVDGEDLAHLLKRIGELPQGKGLQIARQLAAGLAAAHDRGLVHRDLKPANVMIDDRGMVRITDFGLAGTVEEFEASSAREGTPQYMAPEQLRGETVSVRSDLYSLGLVLFEIFTGKRAFEGKTMAELMRARDVSTPESLASSLTLLDPAIERVILRCLEPDPAKRPPSALAVSAALPGGDPLAAALAAGETPSPEMVAAAGDEQVIRPVWSAVALAIVLVVLAISPFIGGWSRAKVDVPIDYPPDVMRIKARDMLARLGFSRPPADSASGYLLFRGWLDRIKETDKRVDRWDRLNEPGPAIWGFWYRESPRPLVAFSYYAPGVAGGEVTRDAPPATQSGMVRVILDSKGNLVSLDAVPPERDPDPSTKPYDWSLLLREAGIDPSSVRPAKPEWVPEEFATERAAWTGVFPGPDAIPMRIEAARYGDLPVHFRIIGPWTTPSRMEPQKRTAGRVAGILIQILIFVAILAASILLARRNIRLSRGDRKGANRLAVFMLVAVLVGWLFDAHHVASFAEFGLFIIGFSWALFFAALSWIVYVALEPYIRRRWPTMLISWSRLLSGRLRDPIVGRDLVLGSAAGAILTMFSPFLVFALERAVGHLPPEPVTTNLAVLGGTRTLLGWLVGILVNEIIIGFILVFVLFTLRVLLRKPWLATSAFVAIFALIITIQSSGSSWTPFVALIVSAMVTFVMIRGGLLATMVLFLLSNLLYVPTIMPGSLGDWTGAPSIVVIVLVAALAIYGFWTSLAGRPLISSDLLDS